MDSSLSQTVSQLEDRVTDTSAGIKEENGLGVRGGKSRAMEGGTTIEEKCEHYGYMKFFFKSKFMDLTMTVREFTFEIVGQNSIENKK